MIRRKSREIPNENHQLATCLLPINAYKMSTTTALKSHTAPLMSTPSFHKNRCSGGGSGASGFSRRKTNTAATAMSTLAAGLCTAATAKATTTMPPMDSAAAVVVNSIIYSKPSFCSIVVDIGGKDNPTANATDSVTGSDKYSRINKPTLQQQSFTQSNGGNEGVVYPLTTTDNQNEAHVYMMSTTMNGSIHHHISEMCDNLIAMGLFGMVANSSEHDDDSLIEFAYDDADADDGDDIEFLHTDEDHERYNEIYSDDDEEDDDDDDDEEDYDTDDDDDDDDDNNIEDYETEDVNDYLYAGEDVTDFSKSPALTTTARASMYECAKKKKKVRFNTTPTVHVMRTWNYAYRAARKGEWEMYARDRARFKLRIQRAALTLNPILDREHRLKVYEQRFAKLYAEEEEEVDGPKTKENPQTKNINQKQKHRKKRRKRRRPNF